MFYASNLARDLNYYRVATEKQPDKLPDIVGELLCRLVDRRLRQNLSRAYRRRDQIRTRVRGRVDMLATERRALLAQGRVACRFEELTMDTPRNRYVRGALAHIATLVMDSTLRNRCRTLAGRLQEAGVTGPLPTRAQLATERFGRHESEDQRLVAASRLAFQLQIPTENAGQHALVSPDRDEHWLRTLFEKAVAGFYATVLSSSGWRVRSSSKQLWPMRDPTSGMQELMPNMYTDIVLENIAQHRRIVIDTKFTNVLTSGRAENTTFKNSHLYQIYAYLRTQERQDDQLSEISEGLLLHPAIDQEIDEWCEIQGHELRIATVNLAASMDTIREQLLERVSADQP